jgi:hypothetical protein
LQNSSNWCVVNRVRSATYIKSCVDFTKTQAWLNKQGQRFSF